MPKMKVLYRMSRAIRRFPEQHYQSAWHENGDGADSETIVLADNNQAPPCGTTLCAGGWIAFQNAPEGARLAGSTIVFADGSREEIDSFAARVARLNGSQAAHLFYNCNTADDIDAMIDVLEVSPDAGHAELEPTLR